MSEMVLTIDDSELKRHLKSMDSNIIKFGRMMIRRKAEILVEELHIREKVVTGALRERTRKQPSRKGWGYDIIMPKYGDYVDRGTGPSKSKNYMPIRKALPYIRAYGIRNVNSWRKYISEHGTKPHPFIRASIMATDRRSKEEMKRLSKRMFKK